MASCCPPPLFGVLTLTTLMMIFFLASCITSFIFARQYYSEDQYDNWILLGGLTSASVTFRVRVNSNNNGPNARLVVATDEALSTEIWSAPLEPSDASTLVVSATATGLKSNTKYYYASKKDVDTDSILQRGSFTTAPIEGQRTSFKFATAGCAWSGSTDEVFSTIRKENEENLFFIHLGDIHYEDLNVESVDRRVQALDRVMNSNPQRSLLSKPLVYMYDDHDWLGNDSIGAGIGREAALESYRVAFPYHEPLPSTSASYHAFTIGTVRFVVTDLRAEVTAESMLSETQKTWLFNELEQASNYDFVIWVSTKLWIAGAKEGADDWGGFPKDREDISNHIKNVVPNNLLMIAADAHMLAFDDGSNTYYGTNAGDTTASSFPILQSGPLDRLASFKGGPYSEGCTSYLYERNHQYSTVQFFEEEGVGCLEVSAYRIDAPSRELQEVFTKKLCGDIFSESNPGAGSCDARYFSNSNILVLCFGGGLFLVAFLLTTRLDLSCCGTLALSFLILVLYGLTLVAGFTIPNAQSINQYDAFEVGLIGTLQMATVVLYLIAWMFCAPKRVVTLLPSDHVNPIYTSGDGSGDDKKVKATTE